LAATTSPSLLLRIRDSQDTDAWECFLDIYTPIVRSYCFQRCIQEADVNDIAQDVMSVVTTSIRAFEYDPAKGQFRAWLGTIAANKIKTFINRQSRKAGSDGETDLPIAIESCCDPDSDWIAIFSDRVYQTACARIRGSFEDATWECFEATWLRNEAATDVAVATGIPVHSVYVNKSRVLKQLEKEVRLLADDMPFHES